MYRENTSKTSYNLIDLLNKQDAVFKKYFFKR